MAAMQPSEEKYNQVNKIIEERFSESEEEYDAISKGYEEIRKMVDYQIINKVIFK
jgi:hypothetical protein